MSKFVIECPSCGRYAEASTGFFAKKRIGCTCGYVINVKTDKPQSELGDIYYMESNYERAAYWYEKAAEIGYVEAQINLAECYYKGYGLEKNDKLAMQWYRKAAEQGDEYAQKMWFDIMDPEDVKRALG